MAAVSGCGLVGQVERVEIREWSKTDVERLSAENGQMNSCEAKQGLQC